MPHVTKRIRAIAYVLITLGRTPYMAFGALKHICYIYGYLNMYRHVHVEAYDGSDELKCEKAHLQKGKWPVKVLIIIGFYYP